DLHGFAHFEHADQITIIAVAVLADGDVEVELLVALVGLRLAQVPCRAGAAYHHAREPVVEAVLQLDDADVDVALLENTVVGQEAFDVIADLQERIAPVVDVVDQFGWQVLMHAADAEILRVHAAARGALIENHQLLAFLEAPKR